MTHAEKHSDELTTVQEGEGHYVGDHAYGYSIPAPEGAVMAGVDLDPEKVREAEEKAARVRSLMGR